MQDDYIIDMRHITKRFPGIVANDDVTLRVKKGEVFALLGENGAGKSTLMSVLFGMYQPDAGKILLRGQEVKFDSSDDAVAAGIGMVHQHFKLVDNFTVAENIVMGVEPKKRLAGFLPCVDIKEANKRVKDISVGPQYVFAAFIRRGGIALAPCVMWRPPSVPLRRTSSRWRC